MPIFRRFFVPLSKTRHPAGCHYPHAMKIRKSPLPPHSILSQYTADYTDCFRGEFPGTGRIPPEKLMAAFWTTMPGWLAFLFKLRNLLVRPFGLKTETDSNREALKEALENGEGYGMMTVVAKTADEMVVSLDDKHLKAWFSVCIENPSIYLSTLVQYHNKLGVAYFTLIRPFHKIVVKSMFRAVMRTPELLIKKEADSFDSASR